MFRRKPLIDADWLLGPAPPRLPQRSRFWRFACFSGGVAVLLAAWPAASTAYLHSFLQSDSSDSDTGGTPSVDAAVLQHPVVDALRQRLPASVPELVAIAARHADLSVAGEAAQVLEQHLEAADATDPGAWGDLDAALSRPPEPASSSHRELLNRLVAKRYSQLREEPTSVAAADLPRLIDAYSALLRGYPLPEPTAGLPRLPRGLGEAGTGGFHEIDRPRSTSARPKSAAVSRDEAQAAIAEHSAGRVGADLSDRSTADAQPSHPASLSIASLVNDANPLLPLQLVAPESEPVASAFDTPEHSAAETTASRTPLPHRLRPTIQTVAYGRPQSIDASIDESTPAPESSGIDRQTLRRTPNAELLGLLASEDAEIAAASVAELQRRGLDERQLSLAIELTRGTIEQRLAAMDHITDGALADPVAWLVWLARDPEPKIRGRAIRILASVNHATATQQLRLLTHQEADPQLRRLLADLAAGKLRN